MQNKAEIIAKAKAAHDELSANYYGSDRQLSKEEFDTLHGGIWNKLEADLIAAGHREAPVEPRDLAAEIDSLQGRVKKLEPR